MPLVRGRLSSSQLSNSGQTLAVARDYIPCALKVGQGTGLTKEAKVVGCILLSTCIRPAAEVPAPHWAGPKVHRGPGC